MKLWIGSAALVAAVVFGLADRLLFAAGAAIVGLAITRPPKRHYASSLDEGIELGDLGVDAADFAHGAVRVAGAVLRGLSDG